MNKVAGYLTVLVLFAVITTATVRAHCQVPCGIYDDQMRIHLMEEHVTTIERSLKGLNDHLGKSGAVDVNQRVRWVMNKEAHADQISEIVTAYFALSGMDARSDLDAKVTSTVSHHLCAADGSRWAIETGQETIAGLLDFPASEVTEAVPDDLVVSFEKVPPGLIAFGSRSFRRVDDVGEQHGRQNPLGSWQSLAGRLKRRAVVVHILVGMLEVVGLKPPPKERSAEHRRPLIDGQHVVVDLAGVQRPPAHMLFRPEEVHAASIEGGRPGPSP